MKTAFVIIGAIVVLLLFGTMLGGINDAQTDSRTDNFIVATAPADTDADVVLVGSLYGASVLNVTSITSTDGTDVPLVGTYTALTRTLGIEGLNDDSSRTLTVTYKIDGLTGYTGVGSFFGFIPLLIVVAVVVMLVAGGMAAFRR